ncbi:MAG: ATP-binding protein [Termitinemataceae bacterium]|nr:MAG: ATP-binding protein [Termitinemataceae bacterium]
MIQTVRQKDRDAVIQALRAGVVPRTAQHLIQVGRKAEIEAMLVDLDRIIDGGSTIRFVIGEYGAGKTFFLNLVRSLAMEKGIVTSNADLTPDKRLHATAGYAKALYMELMRNVSTRTKPEGGAMSAIVERFISGALGEAEETKKNTTDVIKEKLSGITELVNGYDFAHVINVYWEAYDKGDDQRKADAIRWLRGEWSTKSDARKALGVRTIVDDSTWYDQIKLFARFVRIAGYSGFIVCLDEMVNIYKLANKQARSSNYEQILRIVNDTLQGNAVGLGFLMGGTPEFQLDTRRGLFSYDALRRRLGENQFAKQQGMVDFSGPVMRLSSLSQEDFYVLLEKLRLVYAYGDESKTLLPHAAIETFMKHCAKQLGNDYFRTPGTTITAFINLLAVIEQNKSAAWEKLLGLAVIKNDSATLGVPAARAISANSTSNLSCDDELRDV